MSTASHTAISEKLVRDAFVADMTLPIEAEGEPALKAQLPERLVAAGFDFVSFTVAIDDQDTIDAIRLIATYRAFFLARPDLCVIIDTADDVLNAKHEGKLAVSFHFQGTVPVGRDLKMVDLFYKLGVRHMLLAYNQKNFVADGCHELGGTGLSRFGRDLITEMNRVGMFVDVAHTSYKASMEAMEFSDRPVIVSHGNIWGIHEHPRCYRDDQLKAMAATGGVIGLTGLNIFTGADKATPEGYAEQIDYVVQLLGPRHVGFGFDYVFDMPTLTRFAAAHANIWPADGGYSRPDVTQIELGDLPRIVDLMLGRGYGEADVRLILGENWLRLMREVWK